ncbi:hypothetical protein [Bacteriophage Eos]|nr:hypothetical protein [Bacteriophage Eos]
MSTENRVIDIVLDENVPYGMIMQFFDVEQSVPPFTETPVDLKDFSLRASIAKNLDGGAKIADFITAIVDAGQGVASLSLTKANVASCAAAASKERDKYNARLRFVGYYDVIMTRTTIGAEASSFRVMEGKVYLSDGVTS